MRTRASIWSKLRNEHIAEYHKRGFAPIPLRVEDKIPMGEGWNKNPELILQSTFDELLSRFGYNSEKKRRAYSKYCNVGILMGLPYGSKEDGYFLRCIDYDCKKLYEQHANEGHPWLQGGVLVETKKGVHVWILSDSSEDYQSERVDIRGIGTQVVAPPSIHPVSKEPYKFLYKDFDNLFIFLDEDLKEYFPPKNEDTPFLANKVGKQKKGGFSAADANTVIPSEYQDSQYDYTSIDWPKFFDDRGDVLHDKRNKNGIVIRCPNGEQHTTGVEGNGSTILMQNKQTGRWRLVCQHSHCGHLKDQDQLIEFLGGAKVIQPYAQAYRIADPSVQERFTTNHNNRAVAVHIPSDEELRKYQFEKQKISSTGLLPFPNRPPPGGVGELAKWIHATAPNPMPELEVAASIAFAATLLGNAYQGLIGAKPHFYCVGIAPTGGGKEFARSAIKNLANAAGPHIYNRIADASMTSGSAVERELDERGGRFLWLLDEVGRELMPIMSMANGNANGVGYQAEIANLLLKLDGTTGQIYNGKMFAESKKRKTVLIKYPILCLYGTTVPHHYIDALDSKSVSDGFLNRILHFRSRTPPPEHKNLDAEYQVDAPPPHITKMITDWEELSIKDQFEQDAGFSPEGEPDPKITPRRITADDDAKKIYWEFEKEITGWKQALDQRMEGGQDLLARTDWKVRKLAVLLTAANNCPKEEDFKIVTGEIMEYCINLVRYCESEVISLIPDIETTQRAKGREKEIRSILRFVETFGEEGATSSEITRKFKSWMDRKKKSDLMDTLLESGELVKLIDESSEKKGRPAARYVTLQNYTIKSDESQES